MFGRIKTRLGKVEGTLSRRPNVGDIPQWQRERERFNRIREKEARWEQLINPLKFSLLNIQSDSGLYTYLQFRLRYLFITYVLSPFPP